MPRVPTSDNVVPFQPQGPQPSETELAMAAAMMHAEGKLLDPMPMAPPQKLTRPSMDFISPPLWLKDRR